MGESIENGRTPRIGHAIVVSGTYIGRMSAPHGYLTMGRSTVESIPDLALTIPANLAANVSALVAEIFCSHTNVAIRVHQLEPGRVVVRSFNGHGVPREKQLRRHEEMFTAQRRLELLLLVGPDPALAPLPMCTVEFESSEWTTAVSTGTRALDPALTRARWARWLVAAARVRDKSAVEAGTSGGIPTVADVETEMENLFPSGYATLSPHEAGNAVRAALDFYRVHSDKRDWRSGLTALFDTGWPDAGLANFVLETRLEAQWPMVVDERPD